MLAVLKFCGLIELLLVISASILNHYRIGYWNNVSVAWLGMIVMASGLFLRYWAAKTLDEFYTRISQIIEGQTTVKKIPYNVIRHPGYLGTLLMVIGSELSVENWGVLLAAVISGMVSRADRIKIEEKMLKAGFDEEYQVYSSYTWELLPFLY